MSISNMQIKTEVDKLLAIIESKKKVSIKELISSLGTSKETVMRWCELLEKQQLVRMKYPLVGKIKVYENERKKQL